MFCRNCGCENEDSVTQCTSCGARMGVRPSSLTSDDDPSLRYILPVGRSGWAIAAGYLGLFSVLLVFAPFAIVCGVLAIFDLKRNPKKCGMGRAIFGIVMGTLGIVATLVIIVTVWGTSVGRTN